MSAYVHVKRVWFCSFGFLAVLHKQKNIFRSGAPPDECEHGGPGMVGRSLRALLGGCEFKMGELMSRIDVRGMVSHALGEKRRRYACVFVWALVAAYILLAGWGGFCGDASVYRAARSVHLFYSAPEATVFHTEMIVDASSPGSYFMACGWSTGYFGIQELHQGRKVAIFSVWDASRGDDQNDVAPEDRVEVLQVGQGVRIRRFGGEGTGAQCMTDFDWQIGLTNRFCVVATVQSNKTAYAAHLWLPGERKWKHLATFRTRTGGKPLMGLYSFIEDFRRDGRSVSETRRARYFNLWVRTTNGQWLPVTEARFTASNADWESKYNIDAGCSDSQFYLVTGGDTKMSRGLGSRIELTGVSSTPPADAPDTAGPSASGHPLRGYSIPLIDLASESHRQIVVDREQGQYLGHPSTVLLEDGKTILCVYPKGHGRGAIGLKRLTDGGLTCSDRLPGHENWSTSLETPTIHRVQDASGKKRLIVWSGLYPARLAISEDDGVTWTPLRPVGDWGCLLYTS
ncbi:MAG: DUF3472 domain-containing protein, partial [Verrucomicrobiae bacterium]|nr:DUF3472 domain-containing protein [Verrucomicrobiae bacterium]